MLIKEIVVVEFYFNVHIIEHDSSGIADFYEKKSPGFMCLSGKVIKASNCWPAAAPRAQGYIDVSDEIPVISFLDRLNNIKSEWFIPPFAYIIMCVCM